MASILGLRSRDTLFFRCAANQENLPNHLVVLVQYFEHWFFGCPKRNGVVTGMQEFSVALEALQLWIL